MDDDWDLHAVVRGYATAAADTTVSPRTTTASTNNHPFPFFPSNMPYHDDPNSFDFPGLVDDRHDSLQEIYQEFCAGNPRPTTTAPDISATSLMPIPPPLVLQHHHHIMQVSPPQVISPLGSPPQNLPASSIPQPTRPRRRKNQQIKMVKQMTQDELSADSWAWRKYGQKPIKGSPYPRNYYRCSTSKGCSARKQVERSSNDPETFVVTYSGEHAHPRPTHRSSLAGSTRSKFASSQPKSGSINAILSQKGSSSSSSPAAGSCFSPATPSMEGDAAAQNDDVHMAEEVDGDDNENLIMIPNDFMSDDDDMFRAFQEYPDDHSSGGGGDFFSSGLLSSPPWTPTSSAGNAVKFNSGGGNS